MAVAIMEILWSFCECGDFMNSHNLHSWPKIIAHRAWQCQAIHKIYTTRNYVFFMFSHKINIKSAISTQT